MNQANSERARLSLEGLSIGDAFGQQFFFPGILETTKPGRLPPAPWEYTDDTEMAIAIVQILEEYGEINQDALAVRFARRFAIDPNRGYGAGAAELLQKIEKGENWREVSPSMFGGRGSFGNGAAMRAAPLGAWFAEDTESLITAAKKSAEITHAHTEGIAGAVAVALAAGWVTNNCSDEVEANESAEGLFDYVLANTPESKVRNGVSEVSKFKLDEWQFTVAEKVGNGSQVIAEDTVPFCLWMAVSNLSDFCGAMWKTARVGGDIDTNCAIIGGIVALSVGAEGIPQEWKESRESLYW